LIQRQGALSVNFVPTYVYNHVSDLPARCGGYLRVTLLTLGISTTRSLTLLVERVYYVVTSGE